MDPTPCVDVILKALVEEEKQLNWEDSNISLTSLRPLDDGKCHSKIKGESRRVRVIVDGRKILESDKTKLNGDAESLSTNSNQKQETCACSKCCLCNDVEDLSMQVHVDAQTDVKIPEIDVQAYVEIETDVPADTEIRGTDAQADTEIPETDARAKVVENLDVPDYVISPLISMREEGNVTNAAGTMPLDGNILEMGYQHWNPDLATSEFYSQDESWDDALIRCCSKSDCNCPDKNWKDAICGKSDIAKSSVKAKKDKNYFCYYCPVSSANGKDRSKHVEKFHPFECTMNVNSLFFKKVNVVDGKLGVLCRLCDISMTGLSNKRLKRHLQIDHRMAKGLKYCPACLKCFDKQDVLYNEHIVHVHPYECQLCAKKFVKSKNFANHMRNHGGFKPYACNYCDQSYPSKQKLNIHAKIHSEHNVACDDCPAVFRTKQKLTNHNTKVHSSVKSGQKDLVCFCGEVCNTEAKLKWHQEMHERKPKQCEYCGEKFVHAASLTRHLCVSHNERYLAPIVSELTMGIAIGEDADSSSLTSGGEGGGVVKVEYKTCVHCDKYYAVNNLKRHVDCVHRKVKTFACNECSKCFSSQWNLNIHKWTHVPNKLKPYKCVKCCKGYVHKGDYDAHMRSHANVRPYNCNVCGKDFLRKANCTRHVRGHKLEELDGIQAGVGGLHRTYNCDMCDKKFARSDYLKEHRLTHKYAVAPGEKPYACPICGKKSSTKSNHNKHCRLHNYRDASHLSEDVNI